MSSLSFLVGMLVLGYAAGALFFLRFWRDSRDRLFLMFGIAFLFLAVQQVLYALTGAAVTSPALLYLIRLLAFVLILAAIIDKNLKARH